MPYLQSCSLSVTSSLRSPSLSSPSDDSKGTTTTFCFFEARQVSGAHALSVGCLPPCLLSSPAFDLRSNDVRIRSGGITSTFASTGDSCREGHCFRFPGFSARQGIANSPSSAEMSPFCIHVNAHQYFRPPSFNCMLPPESRSPMVHRSEL